MTTTINLALVQMTSGPDLAANLDYLAEQFRDPTFTSADIIVLPEMFAQFGAANERHLAQEETDFNGPVGKRVRQWARTLGCWIIAGTVPVLQPPDIRPRARCYVVNADGELVTHYDKIHLFDAEVADKQGSYRESDSYSPGEHPRCFDSPWGSIGLAVCYDLRFAELFRRLNDQGAQLVVIPSAFTAATGAAHWQVLCRARAIENGFFVAAANQCGQNDAKRSTWGHSMTVNPWGEFVALADQPACLFHRIDLGDVAQARARIPVNANRRL